MNTGYKKKAILTREITGVRYSIDSQSKDISTIYRNIPKNTKVIVLVYKKKSSFLGGEYFDISTKEGFHCKVPIEFLKFISNKEFKSINRTIICKSDYFEMEQICRTESQLLRCMKLCKKIQKLETEGRVKLYNIENNTRIAKTKIRQYPEIYSGLEMKIEIIDNEQVYFSSRKKV